MPDWVIQRFHYVRDTDLGPVNMCTPNKLQKEHGRFTQEGVRYEQSTHVNSLNKNDRTYPLTMSYEQTRNLSGLCTGTKDEQDICEHTKLRADTVAAVADVAMCTLDSTPASLKDHLDNQANLLNVPSIGVVRNTAFPTMQMNITIDEV
ncbi:hypothetical protein V8D89_016323 [Ganoderma adspersum]